MYRLNSYIFPSVEFPQLVDCIRHITNSTSSIERITWDGEIIELITGIELNELQFMAHLERSYYGQTEIIPHLTKGLKNVG